MEQAAQAAILEPAVGEVGAAVRAVAVEQPVAAALVAEQHEVLAEDAHRLDRALVRQFVDQCHGMPVMPHQGAAPGAGADPRDQFVLLGAHHAGRVAETARTVIRGRVFRRFGRDDGKSPGMA
jgi:hypothetical protein